MNEAKTEEKAAAGPETAPKPKRRTKRKAAAGEPESGTPEYDTVKREETDGAGAAEASVAPAPPEPTAEAAATDSGADLEPEPGDPAGIVSADEGRADSGLEADLETEREEEEETGEEPDAETAPEPEEPVDLERLKVTLRCDPPGWVITAGAPGVDPHIEYLQVADLEQSLNAVPAIIGRAKERWEAEPRHPASAKTDSSGARSGFMPARRAATPPARAPETAAGGAAPKLF